MKYIKENFFRSRKFIFSADKFVSALTTAHRHEEIENCPSQDNNVVNIHPAGHNGGSITDTLEERRYFKNSEAAYREHLSESQLHEEHGYTGKEQCQEVGN